MTLKKLKKNQAEIKFINPDTMEVECIYSECFQKFVSESKTVIKTPLWNNYKPIKHKTYFHRCDECSREFSDSDDNGKSIQDYERSRFSLQHLSDNDIDQLLKQLKQLYTKIKDPDKKKMLGEVFDTYKRESDYLGEIVE